MSNTAAAKARLEAQLVELEGRQDRIARDLAEPLNPDSSEQAVEMEDDVSLEGQAALIAREIASVKRALTWGTAGCLKPKSAPACSASKASNRISQLPKALDTTSPRNQTARFGGGNKR